MNGDRTIEEEFVKVPVPKRYIEFLKEFAAWIGYKEEEIEDYIEEAVKEGVAGHIYGCLDVALPVAPLKVQYFKEKFNL